MAQVIGNNQVKLDDGKVVQASEGGWYNGQQYWGGTLSQTGQINAQSNQQGAGQAVSREVIAQTNPANVAYVDAQRQKAGLTPSPTASAPQINPASLPGGSSTTSGAGVGYTAPETINLPKLYESLYSSSGIRDIEAGLSEKTNQYNAAVAKIKDNPYLSEATMSGRIKKIEEKFNADSMNTKNDIAMRKADVETQLNLQTKQFDINSQQAQTAFSQFQSLLSSGALNNASGEDIANLTRSTGISSSMIQSAIEANKAKDVKTETIKFDDGTNQGFALVNSQTGEIIKTQTYAASEPKKATGGGGGSTKAQEKEQNTESAITSVKNKISLKSLVNYYSKVLSIDDIYRLYNQYSPYGQAKETLAEVKQGKFKV